MKLIRWVEEHLSGRSKRSKDTRAAVARQRETNSLFYDPSLLPVHLKLDPSCQLLRSQGEGHTNTTHTRRNSLHHQQHQQQQQQLYDLGECEREESSLDSLCRPEPYATIALASHNGNWMLANYSQDQSCNQRQLRHPQYHSSGHPSASTHPGEGVCSDIYSNGTTSLYYRNANPLSHCNSLIEKEEYLTVYFSVENDDASVDNCNSGSTNHRQTSTSDKSRTIASTFTTSPDIAPTSQIHSRLQPSAQVNCNLNRHHGNHLSVLRHNHQQGRHTQSHHQDHGLFCGNTLTGDDDATPQAGYDRRSGCPKQFQRRDHHRHSHQSYFSHCQINDDSSPATPRSSLTPCQVPSGGGEAIVAAGGLDLLYPGSPFTPCHGSKRYSERSRIKTNPWLRSPWTTPQRKCLDQCPSSSSVSGSNGNSSDSGCSLIPSCNVLTNASQSRAGGSTCVTRTRDTTCDSVGMVTTPSSSISSANATPTTDEEAAVHCPATFTSSSSSPAPLLRTGKTLIRATANGAASKSITRASSTLKCDINKNRLANNVTTSSSGKSASNITTTTTTTFTTSSTTNVVTGSSSSTNNTSGKRILGHRSSCDSSRLYPSCSPRRNSSSGSLSSNNNNSNGNSSHICNGTGGVRRRSKDQSSCNKNASCNTLTTLSTCSNTNASSNTATTDSTSGGGGSSRIPCTAFRTASTGSTAAPGNNSSNSSSCSRRRKRRSRVQSTGNCTGNRISLLTSIVNATNPSSASSSNSPSSSLTEKKNTSQEQLGPAKCKRRSFAKPGKVLPYQLSSPSTSSSTSSLAQLPAPPDSASSQLILQDILTNLATSAKNNLKQPSDSLNESPVEGTVKRIVHGPAAQGNSFHAREGKIECNTSNSNSNSNNSCNSSSKRDDSDDAAVGEINSQADERTTRQEASCLFSDVILLHSNCQGSNNNKSISSNLSRRNNQSQLRPEVHAAGTRNSRSQQSVTIANMANITMSKGNSTTTTSAPHPPPPRCNLERGKEIEGSYHNKNIRQQRSPCSRADTLRATYEEQSSVHRSTASESRSANTPPPPPLHPHPPILLLHGESSDAKSDAEGEGENKSCRKEGQEEEKEEEVKGETQSPPGKRDAEDDSSSSSTSTKCTNSTGPPYIVKLRRSVNNCSTQYHHNGSRQSAPVLVDLSSCPPKELVTSPMATSMIAMGTAGETNGLNDRELPCSVYTGSNDCFTITPTSSRGSSVSFSRSSSMSSSRPGSLVSGSAALSAAGRRYYSSLLNKRRFVPSCIDQMNHSSFATGSSSSCSLFKRLSAMSNEEWVSTATEELICSEDEDDQETEEYESEASQVGDVNVTIDSSRGCQFGASGKVHSDTQFNYCTLTSRSKEPAATGTSPSPLPSVSYNEEVIASSANFAGSCGERVHQKKHQEGASVTRRSKDQTFNHGPVASVTMTHDSEITTCGQEVPSTVAAVTASAVSRRRGKEWAQTNDTLSYMKNRGGGSYIRVQSTSNCMTTSPAATVSGSSASSSSASASGPIVNPCLPMNNCKIEGVTGNGNGSGSGSGSNSLRSGLSGRKNESSALLASVGKEDIHARGLFEARHLREMRKETKATLMQVNENIDSTFSPLQQLRLVSERLEQLLKMEEETSGSNTLTLFVHGKEHPYTRQQGPNEEGNRDYTNGQNGCSHVTQSTRTHGQEEQGEGNVSSPSQSPSCTSTHLVSSARDLPSRNLPLSPSPDVRDVQVADSRHPQTLLSQEDRSVNTLSDGKCSANLPLACDSVGHAISKSPNLLHLSPLTPETPMTEDSGVEISCSSLTPSGDSNASISSCQVTSICTTAPGSTAVSSSCIDAPRGMASLDATVNSCTVTRSVDTSDSPVDVTLASAFSSTQISSTSAFQSGTSGSSVSLARKPVSSSSSSSSSQHHRRVRRTMEHEKLWQQITARLSFNESDRELNSSVTSLLNSFIANSAKQNTDVTVGSLSPCHSSSLPPVNQALGQ